jgi:hypothetical protein
MRRFCGIAQGAPGSGKTALAIALMDAGYQVIRAAFEPGDDVFHSFAKNPAALINHVFEDDYELQENDDGIGTGMCCPHPKAMSAFERFVYNGRVGKETPHGHPRDWSTDTVLVVDTLTSMGHVSENRALSLNASTREGRHLWAAAQDQESICRFLCGAKRRHHTLVLAHLRLISPKAETGYKDETELQKQIKKERAKLEDTGYFPTAVTPGIARNFAGLFPYALLCEEEDLGKQHASKRVLRTKPVVGYQIKCPLDVPDHLPVESALVSIFKRLS